LTELPDNRFQWVMNLDAFQAKTKIIPGLISPAPDGFGVGVR